MIKKVSDNRKSTSDYIISPYSHLVIYANVCVSYNYHNAKKEKSQCCKSQFTTMKFVQEHKAVRSSVSRWEAGECAVLYTGSFRQRHNSSAILTSPL